MELSLAFMTIISTGTAMYGEDACTHQTHVRLLQDRVYIHGVGSQWTGITIILL